MKTDLNDMNKAEKIEFIKALKEKKVSIINGQILDTSNGAILFKKGNKLYFDARCTIKAPRDIKERGFEAVMILPDNGRG